MITYLPDLILFGKGILKYTLNRTEMLLFSDYQSVRCKHLLYMYVFQCIWFTWDLWWFIRLIRSNSYHYLEFYYFSFTAFPITQVSFLICLNCGVKCKLCQATYLVLLFSSHQYLEMSLHYRVLCAFVIFFKSLWLFFIHTLKKIWDFDCLSV